MSFTRYFKLSSYCLIASGFVAIAATGSLDLFSLLLFGSALIASWFVDTARLRRRIPAWALNLVALAYSPFWYIDYRFISHSFVVSILHMIFFMAAVKVMTISADRDYVYLYLISFAEILAASTLTVDITYALSLLIFVLSAVNTLVLFEMRRSHAAAQGQTRIQPLVVLKSARGTGLELFSSFPAGTMSGISLAMTMIILLLAIPLFFLLPRVALGIYNRPAGRAQFISGFSDRVELGEIGTIKESDAVVMRVKLSEGAPRFRANLKWRGIALDHYDGRSWSRSRAGRSRVYPQGEYFKLEEFTLGTELLLQTFYLEALSTDVVFACHKVLAVTSNLGYLQRDSSGSLFTARSAFRKTRYSAWSDVTVPDPSLLSRRGPIDERISSTCLQTPELDPRIGALAREVTRSVSPPFDKARAIEDYLRTKYEYSLELRGAPNSPDPLAMFLFDVRKGHCEYFASAMTIMLRQLGIPARLVNGFRAGEYNNLGDSWTVRQYDAHSWVEAYFPAYGWLEFDPTPPDPFHSRPMFARVLSNLFDAMDLWWSEEVINYDFWKQYRLFGTIRNRITELQDRIRPFFLNVYERSRSGIDSVRFWRKPTFAQAAGWFLVIVPAGAGLAFLLGRRSWRHRLTRALGRVLYRGNHGVLIHSFYVEALDLLAAHGLSRSSSQTPLEFARSLGAHPAKEPLMTLTQIYNRIRFGASSYIDDGSNAEHLLRSLRLALRRAPFPKSP